MKKSLGSFIVVNRRPLWLVGVLCCLVVFGTIAWHAGAKDRDGANADQGFAGKFDNIAIAGLRRAQDDNPYSDTWLAANHGLYENKWTAEYETRLQVAAGLVEISLLEVLVPDYGTDVRQSNANVLGSNENEFQIEVNPSNSLNAIGTSNDGQTAGVGIFRTTDGGVTWTSRDASFYGVQASCCDPGVAFGSDGKAYVIILDTSPAVTYILRSTDGGGTWAGPSQVSTPDRENIAVDPTNSNNVLITYSDLPATNRIKGYKSTDGGVTWGASFFIGDTAPAAGYEQSSQPRIASNGTTYYVGFQQYTNSGTGCAAGVQNVVARSTDSGATWAQTVLPIVQGGACSSAQAGRGIFCINGSGGNFRSRSHPIIGVKPSDPTHVYMIYSGGDLEPNGTYNCGGSIGNHSDTLFRRSTDSGVTWSAPAKINSDPVGANKDQYYPWMSVLPNGQIWVGWNDRRDDTNNFLSKWYQAHSNDEGATWLDINGAPGNDVVSDVQTQPSTFIGDYHGLGAGGNGAGNVLGMWYDSRISAAGDAFTDPQAPPPLGTPLPTPTPTPGVPTPTPTPTRTPTPTPTPCVGNYVISQIGGSIVPGTTDIGNHGDDTVTTIALPFSYTLYDQAFTSINLSSNGNAQFVTTDTTFTNQCLPWPTHNYSIYPYWDDLYLVNAGFGIFTSVSGTAPNRIFNIEWRAQYFPGSGTANLELRLYEGQSRFDVIYGTLTNANTSATAGVQKDDTTFIQYFCNGAGGAATGGQSYILQSCGTPVPSPTPTPGISPTPTRTPTPTPGVSPSPCGGAGQLTTLFASGNNGNPGGAVYFDLTVASSPLTVTSLDTNTSSTAPFSAVQVYVLPGMSSVGHETNMAGWVLVATGSGTGAGLDQPTHVNLSAPIPLLANTLYGVAIVADPAFEHRYTNGNGTNQMFSNANLSLSLGGATNVPFTAPLFSPRVWNGSVNYTAGACATPSPGITPTRTPTPTPVASPSCSPSGWTSGPAQPPARALFQGALGTDNKLYIAGGQNLNGTVVNAEVARYNATTNLWESVAPLPVGTGQVTVGAANGKVFVAGGFILPSAVTNALRIYDIATNTWSSGANMPAAKEAAAGAVVNGKFYVMGGDDGTNGVNTNYIYDIATNTWSTGAVLPDSRTNTYATAAGGMVYVFGGGIITGTTTTAVDTLLRYDPVANSWTNLGSAGTAGLGNYGGVSPFAGGTQLLITSGSTGAFVPGNTTRIFTIATNSFSAGPNLLANRSGHAQGTLTDGRVLVADGFDTATTMVSTVELLGGGGTCPTPTPVVTPTINPTPTRTPTPTPFGTPTPSPTPATLMQFSMAAFPGDESQTEQVIITRTGIVTATSSVNFSATNGTATGGAVCTSGVDFLTVLNQPVQFNPNETSKTVFLTLCPDTLMEGFETANLTLSMPVGGGIGTPGTAVMNINDTANQFRSPTEIDFNLGGPASPYPSTILVANGPIQIDAIRVTLYDVVHQFPDNMDLLLVGPTGIKYIFMADAGGPTALVSPATLTFSDSAATAIPNNGPLVTGSFKPVSWEAPQTNFAAPAPPAPYIEPNSTGVPTLASAFRFTNSNGTWSLYARDDNGALDPNVISGIIAGGWGLEFLQSTAAGVSLSGRVMTAEGAGIRNARVTIAGSSLPEPRVVTTGSFGYFSFEGLAAGETYVVTVNSQRYTFTVPSRVITLVDNVTDVDFMAE